MPFLVLVFTKTYQVGVETAAIQGTFEFVKRVFVLIHRVLLNLARCVQRLHNPL